MTINTKDMLNSILSSISRIEYVRPRDIPNIDLYMDQVTTFMEEQLRSTKRHEEDKILTKTMINNYAKNNLLPPPVKKKYSKEHVLVMIFIYYFKNILAIKDIETLLKKDVARSYNSAVESFPDAAEEDRDYLQIFSFICSLSFDVYVKKLLIEKLIDELPEPVHEKKKK